MEIYGMGVVIIKINLNKLVITNVHLIVKYQLYFLVLKYKLSAP